MQMDVEKANKIPHQKFDGSNKLQKSGILLNLLSDYHTIYFEEQKIDFIGLQTVAFAVLVTVSGFFVGIY